MIRQAAWSARLGAWGLLVLGCAAGAGCCCPLYSVHPVPDDLAETCACIAPCGRKHVYTFCVQSADPLDCANLEGVKEYVQSLGFPMTWFGHYWHIGHFCKVIVRLHQEDPDAHFVVVGFVNGADPGCKLVDKVGAYGICVDLLVRLDSNLLGEESCRPANAHKVITVVASDSKNKRSPQDEAEEMYVASTGPFGPATHSGTLELLARELARLAGSVPAVDDVPTLPFPRNEPTPRPVTTVKAKHEPGEWDFLEPVSVERRQPLPTMVLPPTASSQPRKDERRAGR
jgi:hypothetical protein